MKTIVLITRENEERTTHVSIYLCGAYNEARLFCRFVNHLKLEGSEKLVARVAVMNREYSLEKNVPFKFDDITLLDNRTVQRGLREILSHMLAIALKGARKEVQDHFFRNMSKRAVALLKEDMEYMGPVSEGEIEGARMLIVDVYDHSKEEIFDNAIAEYERMRRKNESGNKNGDAPIREDNEKVLVFCGAYGIAVTVTVSLFDSYKEASSFCDFMNNLKTDKNIFVYAIRAEEMVEYETTQPMLTRFDEILEFCEHDGSIMEYNRSAAIMDTLAKFDAQTLLLAIRGLDKSSRESFLQLLPIKIADEVNEMIKDYVKDTTDLFTLNQIRWAREKIIKAVNKNIKKSSEESPVVMID